MVSAVVAKAYKPLSVKMRIGWDDEHIFVVGNAKVVKAAVAIR